MRAFPKDDAGLGFLAKLRGPAAIQDFLNGLRINFESDGETCRSPLQVMAHKEAHCMEGAMLAAAALWRHGEPPLLLDLRTAHGDDDHVVALFKRKGHWGAISKTNHAVLRFRDPVYRTVRELALSYFNEYFLDSGRKTMRSWSAPYSLLRFGTRWLTAQEDLWEIPRALDHSPHFQVLPGSDVRELRAADPIEIGAGKLTEWRPRGS